MPATPPNTHPGQHIRDEILPKDISVTDAARLLDVGRPALSNLLNGNAALSPDMAARIAQAFGANAEALMAMQISYDARIAKEKGVAASTREYVVPFLQIKANAIEDWATSSISARTRLAVFLRMLVHSTGRGLRAVSFPGNDDGERPGWDGFVEAVEAAPWVPQGKSGWEFGVSEPKDKANGDYAKSVRQSTAEELAETTFVFVTPRRWKDKAAWEKDRRSEGRWKDVRVYDASNLEEWLEQSIPAQAWLAHECGIPDKTQGVLSLDACWDNWKADCAPPPVPALFAEAIDSTGKAVLEKLTSPTPESVVITADSREEAIAFLHCMLAADRPEMVALRDRMIVFSKSGPLTRLVTKTSTFIPIITNPEVEKEFSPHRGNLKAILVYPRNATNATPDVTLAPLSSTAFETALVEMGIDREIIVRLSRESGRSPTVLRRRLAQSEAIRTPEWAAQPDHALSLVPFLWAGAWNASNTDDQTILQFLAHDEGYPTLERQIANLGQIEDPPVWSIGSFRGLVSKVDTLFAIHRHVTPADLDRFFEVAEFFVLSEDDPTLDLPEEKRWMAGAFGKTRKISAALRDGIGETLVLLAVYGPVLFMQRLGIDPQERAHRLVRRLLHPVTARKLEAHSGDLALYAEAAPDTFLDILKADLTSPDSETLELMRPASSGIFGRCPRTGLLWALETLAWSREHLLATVDLLARLAGPVIEDNWVNKPNASLSAIFRCWMPQTSAGLDDRIAALRYLVIHYPRIAWPLCIEQFDNGNCVGHHSAKPRWRPDATGFGQPVTNEEMWNFAREAFELAIAWKEHNRGTLGDLVTKLAGLDPVDQQRIWDLVERWSLTASDEDRAKLREVVRLHCMTRQARRRGISADVRAQQIHDLLRPGDPVLEHAWLFKAPWVEESADELADDDLDYEKLEKRIQKSRVKALRAVFSARGIDGIVALAEGGDAAHVVGALLPNVLTTIDALASGIAAVLAHGPASPAHRSIISGVLHCVPEAMLEPLLTMLTDQRELSEVVSLLVLAPFQRITWRLARELGDDIEASYWKEARPAWRGNAEELCLAVDHLLAAGRPRAAFAAAVLALRQLPPKQLFELMNAMATGVGEPSSSYRLEPYHVAQAFKFLDQSGEIGLDDMARLEFMYLEALDRHSGGDIPNLERHIADHPEAFVQAIALVYRRDDDAEDPEPLRATTLEACQQAADRAYRLLDRLSHIPGKDHAGTLRSENIVAWINKVRMGCAELARTAVCDLNIGKLLGKAPAGDDGVWPCEPVREAIERVATEEIYRGIENGLINARGAHYRARGGDQERQLVAQYQAWARTVEFTFPNVAKILKRMVRFYEREANREDTETDILSRLRG